MKTSFQTSTATALMAAALILGTSTVRADDDTKTARHHHKTAQKAQPSPVLTKDDRHAQEAQSHNAVGGANGPEYRVRTGSHLPEHYNRRGYSTDSRDNEFILDQNDIRLRNSDTPGDALRQVPGVTVSGRP